MKVTGLVGAMENEKVMGVEMQEDEPAFQSLKNTMLNQI